MMRFTQYPPVDQATSQTDGVAPSVKHLLSASGRYVSARARLLMLEARLAAGDIKGALLLSLLAVTGLMAGSVLLIVAVVLWVARLFLDGDTALASAILGVVLLGAAFLLFWRARRSLSAQNLFPVTKDEFNLDKQWLHAIPQKSNGSNDKL